MTIPTEPIGSIPRPIALIEAIKARGTDDPALDPMFDEAPSVDFGAEKHP